MGGGASIHRIVILIFIIVWEALRVFSTRLLHGYSSPFAQTVPSFDVWPKHTRAMLRRKPVKLSYTPCLYYFCPVE